MKNNQAIDNQTNQDTINTLNKAIADTPIEIQETIDPLQEKLEQAIANSQKDKGIELSYQSENYKKDITTKLLKREINDSFYSITLSALSIVVTGNTTQVKLGNSYGLIGTLTARNIVTKKVFPIGIILQDGCILHPEFSDSIINKQGTAIGTKTITNLQKEINDRWSIQSLFDRECNKEYKNQQKLVEAEKVKQKLIEARQNIKTQSVYDDLLDGLF